jgi:hypothetical protein
MFQNDAVQKSDLVKLNQDASQAELDINELYKWLERPLTEEDEEYRDD